MSDSIFSNTMARLSPDKDMKKVTFAQALRLIKYNYTQQVKEGVFLNPIFLLGHPGVGKTALVHQAAKELSSQLNSSVDVTLALLLGMDKLDFYGPILEQPDLNAPVRNRRTRYLPESGNKLLFFDEANRASAGTSNGLLTMFDPKVRAVNDHALGPNVMPVLAGNVLKEDEQSMHIVEFCAALNDRIMWLLIQMTHAEHYTHLADKYTKANAMVQFLAKNPTFISYEGEGGITPRRFEEGIKQISGIPSADLEFIHLNLSGIFGVEASGLVMNHLKDVEAMPGFADIIKGRSESFDWIKKNAHTRIDFLARVGQELRSYTRELYENNQVVTQECRENVEQFLLLLTSEMRLGMIRPELDEGVRAHIATCWFKKNFVLRKDLLSAVDINTPKKVS